MWFTWCTKMQAGFFVGCHQADVDRLWHTVWWLIQHKNRLVYLLTIFEFKQMNFLRMILFLLIISFNFVVNFSRGDLLSQSGIWFGIFISRIVMYSDSSVLIGWCWSADDCLRTLFVCMQSIYWNIESKVRINEKFILKYILWKKFQLILKLNLVINKTEWLYTWIAKNRTKYTRPMWVNIIRQCT